MPEDQIQLTKEMFVKKGLSSDDAQLLTNSMVQSLQQHEARQQEEHDKRVDQDIKRLREEFGSEEFTRLNRKVKGFVKESDLSGETLDAFITCVGAYDSFKLLEKLSRATQDASYAPPPRGLGAYSSSQDYNKIFDDPKWNEKLTANDPKASKALREWA